MRENSLMIRVENVKKQYRLGQIGGGTLRGDLQSWWARKRGKEDPNTLIGTDQRLIGTTFMALNGVSFTVNKGHAVGIIGSNSAILGTTTAEIDAKMAEIIEFSEVGDFIDTPVKRYSSGMFVKLAFSVAAHLDSEIMIMDEVLAVGDMKFQKKCLTKMRQAARRDGKTVLYVSHNMATIRDLCDRCIVLDKGKVIFDGDVDEGIALYLSTKSQEASFIDYSGVKRDNWFKRDNIRLQSVELLDADNEVLERRKPVTVRYRVHVNEAVADVGLRLEMRDEVGNPLGATCVYGLDLQPGYTTFTARYDLSVLAPGKYGSYFTVITQGEGGAHTVEDWVPGMMFRMVDTLTEGETEWNTTAWGPIELPTAAVVEVQHD